MATHIDTNTWKNGLENKLLKTYINSSPRKCVQCSVYKTSGECERICSFIQYHIEPFHFHLTNWFSTGYYLYIEATQKNPGAMARISTTKYTNKVGHYCFSFWYHMYGANIGHLNIFLNDSTRTSVFDKSGNQVNLWLYQTIQVNPINPTFWVSESITSSLMGPVS